MQRQRTDWPLVDAALAALPFWNALDAHQRARLAAAAARMIVATRWRGCGIEVTPTMQTVIAGQAALLLLALDQHDFACVHAIEVHPTGYGVGPATPQRAGLALGEARRDGTVVLAWDAARHGAFDPHDGRNLVLHEFAHALDLQDARADGRPPLREDHHRRQWARVLGRELARLRTELAQDHATLLERDAARGRAELFAVATECFFERGQELARTHPRLYVLLQQFYGQDPASKAAAVTGRPRRTRPRESPRPARRPRSP